jgi:hypothetical protein
MPWNLGLYLEASDFRMDLDELVVPLHETARKGLAPLHKERVRRATEDLLATGQEQDAQQASQLEGWEEERAEERYRILGCLMISYLVLMLMAKLRDLKSHFDKSRPPDARYEGKSHLDRLVNEYKQRLGVDLEASPIDFGRVRELVLARNSVMHNDGWPDEEYKAHFPEQRYIDDIGKINVSDQHFAEDLDHLKKFVGWLVNQLTPLHKAAGAT